MRCEKCRWFLINYYTYTGGKWLIKAMCLMGGCNGSQYEPKERDEVKE